MISDHDRWIVCSAVHVYVWPQFGAVRRSHLISRPEEFLSNNDEKKIKDLDYFDANNCTIVRKPLSSETIFCGTFEGHYLTMLKSNKTLFDCVHPGQSAKGHPTRRIELKARKIGFITL